MAAFSSTRQNAILGQIIVLFLLVFVVCHVIGADEKEDTKPKKKKDIRDYNDADMERLFDQWEEDEEKDPDDLLPHEKPKPKIDLSQIDPKNPESVLQMSKKGQTLMMFVSLSGNPTRDETETITQLWQDQLFNAHYQLQRYIIADDRALFMVQDGSTAWEIKSFLTDQERCRDVTIEGQVYNGRGSGKPIDKESRPAGMDEADAKKSKSKKKSSKKGSKSNDVKTKKKGSAGKDKEAAKIKTNKAGKKVLPNPKENMVLLSEEEAEMLQKGKEEKGHTEL